MSDKPSNERMTLGCFDAYQEGLHLERYRYACAHVKGKKVLDVACGTGYGSSMMQRNGAEAVSGVDVSHDAIEYASQAYSAPGLTFSIGDAQDLSDFADETFDVVTSFETIEHLPDVDRYLAEMRRVLKCGGTYLVSTPDRRLASTMFPIRRKPNNRFHVREYTRREFVSVVSRVLQVDECLGQSFVSWPLAFWPVQVSIKAACYAARSWGAYAIANHLYHHPGDVIVDSRSNHRGTIASYWLIRATRR